MIQVKEYYERYWSPGGFQPSRPDSRVLTPLLRAAVRPGLRCLDVGCGDGSAAGSWITGAGGDYVGVDISGPAVARARAAGLEATEVADAAELPFADATFDVIICSEVLEHLFDPAAALAEFARLLADDGRLVITVPNIVYWRRRVDSLVGRWHPGGDDQAVRRPWRDPHVRFFTVASLGRLLAEAGFDVLEIGARSDLAPWQEVPGLRRLARGAEPGRLYAWLEQRAPGLLGGRVVALARRG